MPSRSFLCSVLLSCPFAVSTRYVFHKKREHTVPTICNLTFPPIFCDHLSVSLKILLWPKSRSVHRAEESPRGRSAVPSAELCGCAPGSCVWGRAEEWPVGQQRGG